VFFFFFLYFFCMKYFLSSFLLVFFIACNGPDKPSTPKPKFEAKDSIVILNHLTNPYSSVDVSPMDMAYLPSDYPIQKMNGSEIASPIARVIYSRPHRQGRAVFGSLLKYGEPWRLGANEATEIELFQPITVQNKKIPKGKYVLYCIPQEDKWTIVFNGNLFSWGLKPDPSKDLFKFVVPVTAANTPTLEYFTIVFEKTATGADLVMAWENIVVRLPIQF